MNDDDDIRSLVRRAGELPSDTFRTNLRRELDEQAQGAPRAIRLREENDMNNTRNWKLVAAAASIVAVTAVGILAVNGGGNDADDLLVTDTSVTETTVESADTSLPSAVTTIADETPPATTPESIAPAESVAPAVSTPPVEPSNTTPTPVLITDRLDLVAGTAFGFTIADPVDPDDVIPTVSAVLGDLTHDTGWYTLPAVETYCMTGVATRVLWWGSYSMSFFDSAEAGMSLWTWSIGDRSASLQDRVGTEPYTPPSDATSPLATSTGITVGSAEADVIAEYGTQFVELVDADGSRALSLQTGNHYSTFKVDNGEVTGIAAALTFC